MTFNFSIPLSRDNLLKSKGQGSYTVKEVLTLQELTYKIDDCKSSLAEIGPVYIQECFDVIYSVLHHFPNLGLSVQISYWNMIIEALTDSHCLFENGHINIHDKKNSLKMLVYCVAQFVDIFETVLSKPDSINPTAKKGRGKSVKKTSNMATGKISNATVWEEERERVVVALDQVLRQDLTVIFEPPSCEGLDDVVNLASGCCYRMLESQSAMKSVELRDSISTLLALIVQSYNQNLSVSVKIVQLLQHCEHLVSTLTHTLKLMATKYNLNSFVGDVIREIGEKDPQDFAIDTSGTRNYAHFITDISHILPSQVKDYTALLVPHLNGESQTMRNAVLSTFGEIIILTLNGPEMSTEDRNLRDTLLDHLQNHLHDISALVRNKALQVWNALCESKTIPLIRLKYLLPLVCGRLEDKSSIVRKSTLQLLSNLLKNNPFSDNLDLEQFKMQLSIEVKNLENLIPPEYTTGNGNENGQNREEGPIEGACPNDNHVEDGQGQRSNGEACPEVGRVKEDSDNKVEVVKQMASVQYFKDAVKFIEQITSSIPLAIHLLGSKTSTDVHESLEFLATAQEFDLSGAKEGVRKSILLMSSIDSTIRNLVIKTYQRLYFMSNDSNQPIHFVIVRNFLSLVRDANIGELASLEEMLLSLMKTGQLPKAVMKVLWDLVDGKVEWACPNDAEYAMMILSMVAKDNGSVVRNNLKLLIEHGFGSNNLTMARYACLALCNSAGKTIDRFPNSHPVFGHMSKLMISSVSSHMTSNWTSFAEQVITTIYKMAEQPTAIVANIVYEIYDKTLSHAPENVNERSDQMCMLSRLISLAGHGALQQMVFLEKDVKNELKRVRQSDEDKGKRKTEELMSTEDELGLGGIGADDMDTEMIKRVCDKEICGRDTLGVVLPVIVLVLSKPKIYSSHNLQTAAMLALSQYMIVSSETCKQYLRLFFTLLESSPLPLVRSNALIALGDLIARFPNLIEPWTKNIYARLCDPDTHVRQCAVTVLTHLILNDMVKVKGQLSEMALCLEDPVPMITDRVKLFFLELSRKGNALYNILPDIIGRLSDADCNITYEKFKIIMSYLFSLIQKDRQCEGLIDKLCHRFRASRSEEQSRSLAFCLSQLSYSERGLRKLQENITCYQSVLTDNDVYSSFVIIVNKLKKFAKPEVKAIVEEFEMKLKKAHIKGDEDEEDRLGGVAPKTPPTNHPTVTTSPNTTLTTPMPPSKSTARKTRGRGTLKAQKVRKTNQRSTRRQPLCNNNQNIQSTTATPLTLHDDFTLNAISSARRSGQSIKGGIDEDVSLITPVVMRKRRRKAKTTVLDDSDIV